MKNSGDGSEDALRMRRTGRVDSFVRAQKGVARSTQTQIRGFDGGSGEADVTRRYPNLFREAGHPQPGFVIVLFAHLAGQAHASVYPGSW